MAGTIDHCSTASDDPFYKLDKRSSVFLNESALDEIGSSVVTKAGILPDIGLSVSCSKMEVNSFNSQQSMMSKTSNFDCSPDVKFPKKVDKALPCPRCNSLDTKFCYYNNYNVNQPRHFCKGCQRYWTAGGSLRNVAIGAGRRKRKHSSLEPESGTAASSVDCPTQQECSATASSLSDCKHPLLLNNPSGRDYRVSGVSQSKLWTPPVVSSSFVSYNLSSKNTQGNLLNEPALTKQTFISQHDLGLIHNSLDGRKQAGNFHEFMQVKSATVLSDKYENPCGSLPHLHKLVSPSNIFDGRKDELKDVSCKLFSAMPSERQASNESGCASSLTTQAISEDACTNGGKSDLDSDTSKVGDNCIEKDNVPCIEKDNVPCKTPDLPYCVPCKMVGGVPAVVGSCQRDDDGFSSGISMMHPWRGPVENGELGAAWTMPPMPFFEGSPADKPGILWRIPWCPTASAVDAAKASLMQNGGAFQKHQSQSQPESTTPEMRVWVPKTLRLKDADEAARSSIWATLGIRDKQGPLVLGKIEETYHCYGKEVGISAVSMQNVNPVAISQSMAFQENV